MRQLYAYVANESTRRLVEDGMSTGLTNTHRACGFSVLYHVFARKQYIKVTLHYLMLHRFKIHSALELSRTDLLSCCPAPLRVREAIRWQQTRCFNRHRSLFYLIAHEIKKKQFLFQDQYQT